MSSLTRHREIPQQGRRRRPTSYTEAESLEIQNFNAVRGTEQASTKWICTSCSHPKIKNGVCELCEGPITQPLFEWPSEIELILERNWDPSHNQQQAQHPPPHRSQAAPVGPIGTTLPCRNRQPQAQREGDVVQADRLGTQANWQKRKPQIPKTGQREPPHKMQKKIQRSATDDTNTVSHDATLTRTGKACALHALFLTIRDALNLNNKELMDRWGKDIVASIGCYAIRVSGLLHDGIDTECKHNFLSTLAWEDFEDANGNWIQISKPELKYHGTSEVQAFLEAGGVFSGCRRRKDKKKGWYHCGIEGMETSLQYAWPTKVEAAGGKFYFRCVIEVESYCWNRCGTTKNWCYTYKDCRRYAVRRLLFFPCASCRHIKTIEPWVGIEEVSD